MRETPGSVKLFQQPAAHSLSFQITTPFTATLVRVAVLRRKRALEERRSVWHGLLYKECGKLQNKAPFFTSSRLWPDILPVYRPFSRFPHVTVDAHNERMCSPTSVREDLSSRRLNLSDDLWLMVLNILAEDNYQHLMSFAAVCRRFSQYV